MGLETGTYVSDLNATNPLGTDLTDAGDDHLRLIKSVLKATFPDASRVFYFEKTAAKTADYTVVAGDDRSWLLVDATAAARTVTLLAAATAGDGFTLGVVKTDASVNTVTVGSVVLTVENEAVLLISDGTAWRAISNNASLASLGAQADVITTEGDIIIGTGTPGVATRLPVGTAGQILGVSGGLPTYIAGTGLPLNYITGFMLSNNATDPTNDIDITKGECRDDADGNDIALVATTRAIDAMFVEGGPGYRDSTDTLTGAKWFHIFAIGGAGKADDLFASTSLAPTLPTGFTYKRRIGSIHWASTTLLAFSQFKNNETWWDVPVSDLSNGTVAAAGTTLTLTVPTGIVVEALFNASQGTNSRTLLFYPPTLTGAQPVVTGPPVGATGGSVNDVGSFVRCPTNTSAQVIGRADSTGDATDSSITLLGWIDDRGANG